MDAKGRSIKILSHKLSNSMDDSLTTSVLTEAITLYGKPEIFNSDQGSQYTAKEHIDILTQNGISISKGCQGKKYRQYSNREILKGH